MLKSIVNGAEHDIVSIPMKGKNLWKYLPAEETHVGVTIRYVDGVLKFSGICSSSLNFSYDIELKAGIYTLSANANKIPSSDMYACVQVYRASSPTVVIQVKNNEAVGGYASGEISEDTTVSLRIGVQSGVNYDGFELRPMLNIGLSKKPYEPYGYQNGWEVRDNQNRIIWGREDELQTTTGTLPFKGYGLDIKEYSIDGNMVQAAEKEYSITGTSPLDFQSNGSNATISISGNETQASNQAYTTSGTSPLSFNADGTNLTALSMDGNMNQASSQPYTVSGTSPISFMNNGTAIDYTVSGNMLQSGTPTPTSPITPQEFGERTSNLFDKNNRSLVFEGYSLAIAGTFSKGGTGIVLRFPCEALTTYTISGYADTTLFRVSECNTDTIPDVNPVSVTDLIKTTATQTYTLTTRSDTKYILIQVGASSMPDYINVLMLNTGLLALPYEPYGYKIPITNGSTTYNIYLSEPLRKIVNYRDTVSSDGTVKRRIVKLVLTGSEDWSYIAGVTSYGAYYRFKVGSLNSVAAGAGEICTHYQWENISSSSTDIGFSMQNSAGYNGAFVAFRPYAISAESELATWKTYLAQQYSAGTPVTLWYVLATPQTDTATVPTITPTSGNNTLSVDTTLAPSNITITSNSSVFPGNPITPIECGVLSENLFDNNQITTNENGAERPGVELPAGTYSIYNTSSRAVYYRIGDSGTGTQVNSGNSKANIVANDTLYVWQYPKEDGVMVIEGATAPTEYEPYGKYKIPITVGSTTKNIFINQPIRKISDYSDSIGSDGVVTRNIKKLVFDGTETWTPNARNDNLQIFQAYTNTNDGTLIASNVVCSHLETVDSPALTYSNQAISMRSSSTGFIIGISYGIIGTVAGESGSVMVEKLKSYIAAQYTAGTPVEVWYVLSTPDTTETTTIPTISTVNGANTLTTGTPITPSNITISTSSSVYPKNPIYPEECGDKTANLFDDNNAEYGKWVSSDGTIVTNATYAAWYDVKVGTTSTFTIKYYGDKPYSYSMVFYDSNGDFLSRDHKSSPSSSYDAFHVPENAVTARFQVAVNTSVVMTGEILKAMKLMLNIGSAALPYEPYGYKIPVTIGSNTNYIYTKEPIRKIGNYADVVNSDGTVTRRIKKLVLDGAESNWSATYWAGSYVVYFNVGTARPAPISNMGVCSHFVQQNGQSLQSGCFNIQYTEYNNRVVIGFAKSGFTTLDDFKAYLASEYSAGRPVTVWYALETSTTEQTTIPTLTTVNGTNTATIGTTLAPSSITINATSKVYPNNPIIPEMCGVRTGNLYDNNSPYIVRCYYSSDTNTFTPNEHNAFVVANVEAGKRYFVKGAKRYNSSTPVRWCTSSSAPATGVSVIRTGTFSQSDTFVIDTNSSENYLSIFLCGDSDYNAYGTVTNAIAVNGANLVVDNGWQIPFENHGENLWNYTIEQGGWNASSGTIPTKYTSDDPKFTIRCGVADIIPIPSNTMSFTFQSDIKINFVWVDANGVSLGGSGWQQNGSTVTAPENATSMTFILAKVDDSTCSPNDFQNIMLTPGSTPKPYSHYLNETIPVYLGEVPTVRRIKKVVFTGQETWTEVYPGEPEAQGIVMYATTMTDIGTDRNDFICSHFFVGNYRGYLISGQGRINGTSPEAFNVNYNDGSGGLQNFKAWLASEYAAGHPVTLWYALETPETAIVNEPICKIGDYADELTAIQVHGLSAPLYGIGNYKDILNLSTGVVTRKVKKLVLTGEEADLEKVGNSSDPATGYFRIPIGEYGSVITRNTICTHFQNVSITISTTDIGVNVGNSSTIGAAMVAIRPNKAASMTVEGFRQWLVTQYANGTPVTVWYVLNTPETETVTVPTGMTGEIEGYLTQISTPTPTHQSIPKWNGEEETGGTYAVTVYDLPEIPTTTGQNKLTVDTTLAPYNVTIDGHIKYTYWGKIREDVRSGLAQTKFPV